MLRIRNAEAIGGFRLRLTLTDGTVIERDVAPLLRGPVFERIRSNPAEFASVTVEVGTVVWPGGADLCPICSSGTILRLTKTKRRTSHPGNLSLSR